MPTPSFWPRRYAYGKNDRWSGLFILPGIGTPIPSGGIDILTGGIVPTVKDRYASLGLVSEDPDQPNRSAGIVRRRSIADRDHLFHSIRRNKAIYLFIQGRQFFMVWKIFSSLVKVFTFRLFFVPISNLLSLPPPWVELMGSGDLWLESLN